MFLGKFLLFPHCHLFYNFISDVWYICVCVWYNNWFVVFTYKTKRQLYGCINFNSNFIPPTSPHLLSRIFKFSLSFGWELFRCQIEINKKEIYAIDDKLYTTVTPFGCRFRTRIPRNKPGYFQGGMGSWANIKEIIKPSHINCKLSVLKYI
jgi:hypothetical protein